MDQYANIVYGIQVRRLLETFFSGFGISFAVSIFVVPFTSRDIASMRIIEVLHGYKKVLQAQSDFMLSIPQREWYSSQNHSTALNGVHDMKDKFRQTETPWPEAQLLKESTTTAAEALVTVQSELRYVKRELAWSKLGAQDFVTIYSSLKDILLPILGMESLVEVTSRIEKRGGWQSVASSSKTGSITKMASETLEQQEKDEWIWLFDKLRGPVRQLKEAMVEGLDHSLYTLEFAKRPKTSAKSDLEAKGYSRADGREIAANLDAMIQQFIEQREAPLKEWCSSKGMDDSNLKGGPRFFDQVLHQRHQSQLYLVLDVSNSAS